MSPQAVARGTLEVGSLFPVCTKVESFQGVFRVHVARDKSIPKSANSPVVREVEDQPPPSQLRINSSGEDRVTRRGGDTLGVGSRRGCVVGGNGCNGRIRLREEGPARSAIHVP